MKDYSVDKLYILEMQIVTFVFSYQTLPKNIVALKLIRMEMLVHWGIDFANLRCFGI